jgi:hypothetical protein
MKTAETLPAAIHNQTVETFTSIIKDWIPPGTVSISDSTVSISDGTVIISDFWASHSTL